MNELLSPVFRLEYVLDSEALDGEVSPLRLRSVALTFMEGDEDASLPA